MPRARPASPGPGTPDGSFVLAGRFGPAALTGRVLDQGEDAAGHEPGRADRRPGAGHLADLDESAPGDDVHPAARPGRGHLVGAAALAGVDDDLDPVPYHSCLIPRAGAASQR